MWSFLKKRREAKQAAERQRKSEKLLNAQAEFLVMYEQLAKPATVQNELARE